MMERVLAAMLLTLTLHAHGFHDQVKPDLPAPKPWLSSQLLPLQQQAYNQFNVLDFHAAGDGLTDDTQAFLDAWRLACNNLDSVMIVPPNMTFLLQPTTFHGPCLPNFTLEVRGTIVAPGDSNYWANRKSPSWIEIKSMDNFTIQGGGALDGQGHIWWATSCKKNHSNPCRKAPTAIVFRRCNNIKVKQLALQNSQQIGLGVSQSTNVLLEGLYISNPHDSPNTDGIHIERSQSLTIQHATIATGDDCISIGQSSFDILIQDILCGPGHGISIGSLGRDKSTAYVHNITVQHVILKGTTNGLRIKTWQGGEGYVRKVSYSNILMFNVSNPIIIDQFYCEAKSKSRCEILERSVEVNDVVYSNILGTSFTKNALKFQCSSLVPCTNILLQNVLLVLVDGSNIRSFCKDAYGNNDERDVIPSSCLNMLPHPISFAPIPSPSIPFYPSYPQIPGSGKTSKPIFISITILSIVFATILIWYS